MRRTVKYSLTVALALFLAFPAWALPVHVDATVDVEFSPRGGCTKAVVDALNSAKFAVLVQAYSFTSPEIITALRAAQTRGVDVQIILDKGQDAARYAAARAGLKNIVFDRRHTIAHNKCMIIDQAVVITGSFNFTSAAQNSNAENLLVIPSPALAKAYKDNWSAHRAHSEESP
jgi:phosphatidylserine/phosphatidylglycerophosphate/cardiolipin synthase-like enzyme